MKSQRRIPGMRRLRIYPYVPVELFDAIVRDGIRWDSSLSWIAVSAMCAFYGVEVETPMKSKVKGRKRGRNRSRR